MTKKLVFMGSPDFALPALKALAEKYQLVGVVTQPDRPAGRGRSLTPPPVKTLALSLGIEVIQPEKMKEPDALAKLHAWQPDVIVVVAFGQILRQDVLDLAPYGCLNVHPSLLPRWRGAAPIQAAILNGDSKTGVTIMQLELGLDSGPILSQKEEPIRLDDTADTLSERLARISADLLIETMPGYFDGTIQPRPPSAEEGITFVPRITKEEGVLDFNKPAEELERKVRAFNSWPGTFFMWKGQILKVIQAHTQPGNNAEPGQKKAIGSFPAVATAAGWLVLDEVQPAGKKAMPGKVFLSGARGWEGLN